MKKDNKNTENMIVAIAGIIGITVICSLMIIYGR